MNDSSYGNRGRSIVFFNTEKVSTLKFNFCNTDPNHSTTLATLMVNGSSNGGSSWTTLVTDNNPVYAGRDYTVDISSYDLIALQIVMNGAGASYGNDVRNIEFS